MRLFCAKMFRLSFYFIEQINVSISKNRHFSDVYVDSMQDHNTVTVLLPGTLSRPMIFFTKLYSFIDESEPGVLTPGSIYILRFSPAKMVSGFMRSTLYISPDMQNPQSSQTPSTLPGQFGSFVPSIRI